MTMAIDTTPVACEQYNKSRTFCPTQNTGKNCLSTRLVEQTPVVGAKLEFKILNNMGLSSAV